MNDSFDIDITESSVNLVRFPLVLPRDQVLWLLIQAERAVSPTKVSEVISDLIERAIADESQERAS